jgi:hypothetical protein
MMLDGFIPEPRLVEIDGADIGATVSFDALTVTPGRPWLHRASVAPLPALDARPLQAASSTGTFTVAPCGTRRS